MYRPYTVPAKDTVFGVQQPRFKGPASYTPGPGYYGTEGTMAKKTYNISYNATA